MKAKRILSLLLTVAMIATCVTAFAAPAGYDDYVKSGTSQILSEGQTLYSGAAMPILDGEGAIRADVTPVLMTDEDLMGWLGVDAAGLGCPDGYSVYLVTVDAKDLGTLYAARTGATAVLYKYHGFKLNYYSMNFEYGSDVVCLGTMSSALGEDVTASIFAGCGFVSDNEYKFEYSDGTAKGGYPSDNSGVATNADGIASVMFFAEPGAVITLKNGYAMYTNYKDSKAVDASGSDWSNTTVAYWHPATITLGAAAPSNPTVGGTTNGLEEGEKYVGVAGNGKIYDNAIAVNATITPVATTTEIGVVFAPQDWLGSNELTAVLDGVRVAKKTGVTGGVATTIKAALKDIPRKLNDTEFVMVTRAYAYDGTTYTYANAVPTTMLFTKTAE